MGIHSTHLYAAVTQPSLFTHTHIEVGRVNAHSPNAVLCACNPGKMYN